MGCHRALMGYELLLLRHLDHVHDLFTTTRIEGAVPSCLLSNRKGNDRQRDDGLDETTAPCLMHPV